MGSWRKVWDFSQPLTTSPGDPPDEEIIYGVAKPLPVIEWDRDAKQRRIIPMRWGFPHAKDWRRPQPIHARSETVEITKAFAEAFANGQRGIVAMKTFNEGKELSATKTEQWTIDPQDSIPRGFAFVWRRFEIPDLPQPMLACVMVTVPANKLLRDTILEHDPDPRMPAILEDADWQTWLGENDATPEQAKAVLKTMEGVNWKIAPEQKKAKERNTTKARPEAEKAEPGLF